MIMIIMGVLIIKKNEWKWRMIIVIMKIIEINNDDNENDNERKWWRRIKW